MALAVIVVELISQSLLNHGNIIHHGAGVLGFLLPFGLVDLVLFYFIDFILNSSLVATLQDLVPFKIEVHLQLRDLVVFHDLAVLVGKVALVLRGLRVVGLQHAHRLKGVQLLLGELHHFHLVDEILVHLVQLVFYVFVLSNNINIFLWRPRWIKYFWLRLNPPANFPPFVFKLPFFI